jgi:5-methyltetrahydropteroyltriglutamate--homocysteine methyltransferase
MKRSEKRILTTHTGSLARPVALVKALEAEAAGQAADSSELLRQAVAEIVRVQVEIGLDVVDDGEMGKPSFVTYINDRLGGFEDDTAQAPASPWAKSRETAAFPEFYARADSSAVSASAVHRVCTGPIVYQGQRWLQRDIMNLKAAAAAAGAEEVFMPAISPTNVENWQRNEFYKTQEEYLFAIAAAMHEEYQAIVDAGLILQIDDPRFVTYYVLQPDISVEQWRRWAEVRVEAVNFALRGISPERVRFHTCYSINMGPRVHDLEMKHAAATMLKINAGAFSFEYANPRHEHEWRLWEELALPAGKILIPGFVTHTSVLVEHPELVAERILRFARTVGRENLLAGTDCGFGTFASAEPEIHPTIAWAKLRSLVEGARLASRQLWA